MLIFFVTLIILTSCTHSSPPSVQSKKKISSSINQIITDLSFFPVNGSRFRLSELEDVKAIVIVMREKDCPISEKYGPRLARLEQKYSGKGIFFIYNYVGQVKKKESAKNDLKNFGFKGPYVIDSRQTVIDALNVETTGDVFILTPQRKIIYRGPVDDQFHLLKSAIKPRNNYVLNILESIVSGKVIEPKEIPAHGSIVNRPVMKNKVFWNDVAPIIQRKCVICHNPSSSGPINYINYEDVAGRSAMFKHVLENDLMPPWFVDPNTGPWKNDLSLTPKEKALLLKWVADGTPKRSKKTRILWPETMKLNAAPDYVIHLPEKVLIPSEGSKVIKVFNIQTNFKEDKWISTVKFLLKPKVIHHIVLYIMNLSSSRPNNIEHMSMSFIERVSMFFVASGGNENIKKRKILKSNREIGYKLPQGSKLVLEVHYESIGKETIDDFTQVQISFHRKKPKYKGIVYSINNQGINIPPQVSNYKIRTSYKIQQTMHLIKVHSHMHLRGKASSIFVVDPKGLRKRIFGIDPYISTFENIHELATPLIVLKGSILECINWFDNSKNNPINPNPNKQVRYGLFTEDEMSQCYFFWRVPLSSDIESRWIIKI